METESSAQHGSSLARRARALASQEQQTIFRRTDRLFAGLMLFQWLAGIGAALWLSPRAWAGAASSIHLHVWAALYLGGLITFLPVFLALTQPGTALTRHTIAVGQMLTSALLIDLTGGRIETHFHVFGSLAFWLGTTGHPWPAAAALILRQPLHRHGDEDDVVDAQDDLEEGERQE